MRIRKRQVPLPLSSLSPVPISDPHMNSSPVVQLHRGHDPHQNLSQKADAGFSQPSDLPNNQSIGSKSSLDQKDKVCLVLMEEGDYNEKDEQKSNNSRKSSILGAEIAAAGLLSQLSSSSHQVVRRWFDGEKAVLLKKRRRGYEEEEEIIMEKKDNKKVKTKMKNKMNKKFDDNEQDEEKEEEKSETKGSVDSTSTISKKRARCGAIMEGSRCSRVNGRGWRCCQQTLVGYSLCEHHLGKGRLRSMNSVSSRSLGSSAVPTKHALSSSSSSTLEVSKMKQELVSANEADEEYEKPLLMTAKKRMKLGMVKARSISSLLGQKDNEIIATD